MKRGKGITMKIILDTDGTMTDFNAYIKEKAIPYFQKHYGMTIQNPNALEVEDIFQMDDFFAQKYQLSKEEAKQYTKKALDRFWVSIRFVQFSLLEKFRPGTREYIQKAIQDGHEVEVHTSRAKSCENTRIGSICRAFTIGQYWINGIYLPTKKFHFYPNDSEKVKGILAANPDLVFDDKPEILSTLTEQGIKSICVEGCHNQEVQESKNLRKIKTFTKEELEEKLQILLGVKSLSAYERAAKSDVLFRRLTILKRPMLSFFQPIVLHPENILEDSKSGIIYAPNHRSTLDPLAITAVLVKNVHWAALLRFFEGKDSIFNNSKNPILCQRTATAFRDLAYFPIERKRDNPNANNLSSIRDMISFLRIRQKVGIFPEGTTRRPPGKEFGTFDDAFLLLAKKTDSWVQPITTLWIREVPVRAKVIINFGKPFKVGTLKKEEAMEHYLQIQYQGLQENYDVKESLGKEKKLQKRL